MKIYFYDGYISQIKYAQLEKLIPQRIDYLIDAADGVKSAIEMLQTVYKIRPDGVVLTNHILAFSHWFGWNSKENHTDIYLYVESKDKFIRIDELTDKELREGHCVDKMYLAGSFDLEE